MSFGQLRSLLQLPADGQRWSQILTALESMSVQEREQVGLPYARAHLERWPPGLRAAPAWARRHLFAPDGDALKAKPYHWIWSLLDAVEVTYHTEVADAQLERMAQDERMAQLHTLSFEHPSFSAQGLEALAQSPHLGALRRFEIKGFFGPNRRSAWTAALATAPWLSTLTHLSLSGSFAESEQLRALLSPLDDTSLQWQSLDLSDNNGLFGELDALSDHAPWIHLKALSLDRCAGLGEPIMGLHFNGMPHLEALSLSDNGDLSTTLREAAQATRVKLPLRSLKLNGCTLESYSLERFADCLEPGALKALSIQQLRFRGELFELLNDHPAFGRLEQLNLNGITLSELAFAMVAQEQSIAALLEQSALLKRLKAIDLSYNKLNDDFLEAFINPTRWPAMESLVMAGTPIKAKPLGRIFKGGESLPLRVLDLRGSHVKDEQVARIFAQGQWPGLEELYIFYGSVSLLSLYRLGSSSHCNASLRLHLRQQLFERLLLDPLSKLVEALDVVAQGKTKRELAQALALSCDSPPRFAAALCHPLMLDCLNVTELRATLRACGERGYSKLQATQLKRRVLELLEHKPQALMELAAKVR